MTIRTPSDDTHPVLPGCEPWSSPGGGPHGALVLHGFTGSPVSMRPLAEALADAGFAVEMPRLPGHGTAPADLALTTWHDWLAEAERALAALQARTPDGKVVVVGLSMGGALTLALGTTHPELAGIVPINAPTKGPADMMEGLQAMLDGGVDVIDSIGGDIADPDADECSYDQTPLRPLLTMLVAGQTVLADLGEIRCPALVINSRAGPRGPARRLRRDRRRPWAAPWSGSSSRRASTWPPSTTTRPSSRPPRSPSPPASPRARSLWLGLHPSPYPMGVRATVTKPMRTASTTAIMVVLRPRA